MRLDTEQLAEVMRLVTDAVEDANRKGCIFNLLHSWGLDYAFDEVCGVDDYNPMGQILVIGGLDCREEILLGVAKKEGYEKKRFMFLDYEQAKRFNYDQLQYSSRYSLIMIGPTPHKTTGTSESRSLVAELESPGKGYPRAERLWTGNELKITKNNFSLKLKEMTAAGIICPDHPNMAV